MKTIGKDERRVVNLKSAQFEAWDESGVSERGTSILQLNPHAERGTGFYIYKMEPGASSAPHRHGGAEEFFIIEGEIVDNDGTVYRAGDVVWLAPGTEHNSHSPTGAVIAVYAEKEETTLEA
ncbi:MAG: cupin domain-containing protein [Rhodobiaceae bacterium]|nr:cupin domain-containing protein [Rhodobiaceae bacterium]MCC0014814.1 cupin domain-containing protein [Rhodobiaceae bacterium]MCC0042028.1 cupin domain-containing protein [Rhodobiaceae bacterium]MCC0053181.1 cupin domain-containing protein [Rhodobiaceae bacterium]